MVWDPHWRKARLHLNTTVFQPFAWISYQLAIQDLSIGINLQDMTINNLQFADNIVLIAYSVEELQILVTNVHTVSRKCVMTINKGKTEVQMIQKKRALLLSIATYGSEYWTLQKRDEHRLLVFEMSCRREKLRNTSIRNTTKCQISIIDKIKVKQLSHFGHTIRMSN